MHVSYASEKNAHNLNVVKMLNTSLRKYCTWTSTVNLHMCIRSAHYRMLESLVESEQRNVIVYN